MTALKDKASHLFIHFLVAAKIAKDVVARLSPNTMGR